MAALCVSACAGDTATVEVPEPLAPLQIGETRQVDLRFLRFDVEGFEQAHSLQSLRALPRAVLENIWLADVDITPLVRNGLQQLRAMEPAVLAEQPQPVRNLHRLLTMTPDNAELDGTNLEDLIALSAAVGIPPAKALGNLLDTGVTDDFIPPAAVARVLVEQVVGTHPAARWRRGPIDVDHPDGLYPVAANALPITLADVVTNFENLAARFGPSGDHPGFLLAAHGVSVVEEDFRLISKVDANALPYKGVDLTDGSGASVNSIGGQIATLHDFSDPDWMRIEGLVETPTVETLTFVVRENDEFVAGGDSRDPAPLGNSPAWQLPPWEFEHQILATAKLVADDIDPHCDSYQLATGVVAFEACVDESAWVTLESFDNVGSPPPPAYLWDLNLELAQVRLHDGGLAEGDADVELTLRDVDVGIPPAELIEQAKSNLQANPEVLRDFASLVVDATVGDADFYYLRSRDGEDWLYFVARSDLRVDDEFNPVRDYADYDHVGFFADPQLQQKVSSPEQVDGDDEHEKVRILPGDVLYIADDAGRIYSIAAQPKPSRAWISLLVTRVS